MLQNPKPNRQNVVFVDAEAYESAFFEFLTF